MSYPQAINVQIVATVEITASYQTMNNVALPISSSTTPWGKKRKKPRASQKDTTS